MTWIFEDALPIWLGGALLVTLALVVYAQVRSRGALRAVVAVVLLTAILLLVEWLVVTPREAITRTLYDAAAAVEANELEATLTFISPQARQFRADIEALMPQVDFRKARVAGDLTVEIDELVQPIRARARFRAVADATLKRNGMSGVYVDMVEVYFVHDEDGQWLIEECRSDQDWRRAAGVGRAQ